jgi:hypothetical protein
MCSLNQTVHSYTHTAICNVMFHFFYFRLSSSSFLPEMEIPPERDEYEEKKKQSLCYVLAIRSRDVTEISLFLSILPPTSSYTATGCIKRNTTTTLRSNTARKAKCSSNHISLLSLYRPIWNRRLLWKLTLCQLVKQFPAYHETRHTPLP